MIVVKNKTLHFFSLWLLIALLTIVIFITIPFGNFQRTDFNVFVTFAVNGFLWICLLIKEANKYSYSLMMMHWLFCFLFFFVAPIVQFANNFFPWVNALSSDSITKANIYLTFWTFFVILGHSLKIKPYKNKTIFYFKRNKKLWYLTLFLTFMSVLIMIYRLKTAGFSNLLSRGTASIHYSDLSSISLILNKVLQAISYFAVIFSFINEKINKRGKIFIIIAFATLLISYFPSSLSRNAAGVVYFGLLLTMSSYMKKNKNFLVLFLSLFIIIFPFLNAFRRASFYDVDIIMYLKNIVNNISNIWMANSYDAYTMLNVVMEYININGNTFGHQLLGVFFFFIPRTLWLSKPIGSGAFVSGNSLWNFTNVSCPLPAEALINFGITGLIIFAIFVGFICKKIDSFYWKNIDVSGEQINKFELIYPVLLMFFFFMCRGDLLSSTAYMIAYIIVWYILIKFININIKIKNFN